MFRKIQNVLVFVFVIFKTLLEFFSKFFEVLQTLTNDLGVNAFLGENPLPASATPHGGPLGIPGNFHQAPTHNNEDFSIFWKVAINNNNFAVDFNIPTELLALPTL